MYTKITLLSLTVLMTIASGAHLGREKIDSIDFIKNTIDDGQDRPPRMMLLTSNPELVAELLKKRSSPTDTDTFNQDQPHLISVPAKDNTAKNSAYIRLPEQIRTVMDIIAMLTDLGVPGWSPSEVGQSLMSGDFGLFRLPLRSLINNTFEAQDSSNNIEELVIESLDSGSTNDLPEE